jgi:hypothetical protein
MIEEILKKVGILEYERLKQIINESFRYTKKQIPSNSEVL